MRNNRFLLIIALLAGSLLLPTTVPVQAQAWNPLGIATFLFSFFTSRPRAVVDSRGTFELRLTVPPELRTYTEGLQYLWARPMQHEGERLDSRGDPGGYKFILPAGWEVQLEAGFNTRRKRPNVAYVIQDGMFPELEIRPPYRYQLPTNEAEHFHTTEMGVELDNNGGGSFLVAYRCPSLVDIYRYWLVDNSNAIGRMALDQYRKSGMANPVLLSVEVKQARGSLVPGQARLALRLNNPSGGMPRVLFNDTVFGFTAVAVEPGAVLEVLFGQGPRYRGELLVDGRPVPINHLGQAQLPPTINQAQLVLWPTE